MEDSPVKDLNEVHACELSDVEFKRMVIRRIKELTDKCKELSDNDNNMKEEIETINKNQEKINTVPEKNIY